MIIKTKFIDEMLQQFFSSFDNEQDWCEVSGSNPNIDAYGKHKYQKLYCLKYLPAYYFEYCALASKLHDRLNANDQDEICVASFGCGLSPDYYALEHNLGNKKFKYEGFDAFEWSMRKLMPDVGDNFNFNLSNVMRLRDDEINKYDVFIFPKSIGDINDSSGEAIQHLANVISNSVKKRIYFLNSYVSKDIQNISHINLFEIIHERLIESGFSTSDDHRKTFYSGNRLGQGLKGINYNFNYDSNFCIVCKDEDHSCRGCNVVKSPILTNKFMDFQILEYIR